MSPLPAHFDVRWSVDTHFVDSFVAKAPRGPGIESVVTLAQGLPNADHVLEIRGGSATPIAALRVYRPPLARAPDALPAP